MAAAYGLRVPRALEELVYARTSAEIPRDASPSPQGMVNSGLGPNRVTLRGRFVELRALASSSRGIDGSTGNGTLSYLSNEPKSDS